MHDGQEKRRTARAGERPTPASDPDFLGLSVSRTGNDCLIIALRYSYRKRPPPRGKRTEMAKVVLRETLDRLESGKVADVGFAEDALRRVRTDKMEV